MKSGYMQRQWELIRGRLGDDETPFEPLPDDLFEDDPPTPTPEPTSPPDRPGP